jgi:hypothetical protein
MAFKVRGKISAAMLNKVMFFWNLPGAEWTVNYFSISLLAMQGFE